MFNYNKESRLYWLNGNTFESNLKFELMGILMGVAIYNSVILDLNLPIAIYKKLLNIQPTLEDLQELNSEFANSLKFILESTDPNLEQLLYQNFVVELDVFGGTHTHELIPDGAETYVN